jgi:hypothetical protein
MIRLKTKPHFSTLSSEKIITESEARRAIYVDFEGFTDKTPSLIGIQCDEEFSQVVLSEDLRIAAAAKAIAVCDGKPLISHLLSQAKSENRKIVAYSSFEKEQCYKWYGVDISSVYVNANLVARSWKKLAYPKLRVSGLKDYLKLVNYPRGDHLGIKQSTQRIASVANMLAKKKSFEDLTPVVKAKWTKLLDHNKIDVQGMKFLILQTFIAKK